MKKAQSQEKQEEVEKKQIDDIEQLIPRRYSEKILEIEDMVFSFE